MTLTMPARLRDDNQGAVMLTGLIMSCFLIGALWFVIGIGDAIVFRDTMQEAADHGAFTAAAMNAKGMNFISLCNLIMFAGTVIYIILGVITDVLGAIHAVCMFGVIDWECAAECIADSLGIPFSSCPTYDAWNGMFKVWKTYYKGYETGLKALHVLEKTAAIAYPAAGAAEAYEVGNKYDTDQVRHTGPSVLALSGGMVPVPGKDNTALLPVSWKKYGELCEEVVAQTSNGLVNAFGLGGSFPASSFLGAALNLFDQYLGGILKYRYCNSGEGFPFDLTGQDPNEVLLPWPFSGAGPGTNNSFWDEDGYYVPYTGSQNGNMYFQTWAMNIGPTLHDRSDSHVLMAATKPLAATKYTKDEGGIGYFAQAEMYFDCDQAWNTPACDFHDHAAFTIRWRSRLVNLNYPQVVSGALNTAMSLAQGPISNLTGAIAGALGAGTFGQLAISNITTTLQKKLNNWATGPNGAGQFDPQLKGVYH